MGRRDGGTEGAEESRGGATPTDLGAALEVEEVSAPLEARPATVRQALVHALEAHTTVTLAFRACERVCFLEFGK